MTTSMQIPDAAVQAAHAEYRRQGEKNNWYSWPCEESMRSILTAALPHLVQLGFELKQLEWVKPSGAHFWQAICAFDNGYGITEYSVDAGKEPFQLSSPLLSEMQFFHTLEAAKAAAQADFERRVYECIVTNPVDVAAVREAGFREGLEAAAKWHEEHAIGYETEHSNLSIADELAAEHRGSATAIRALSAEPVQGEQWRDIATARPLEEWHEDYGDVVWWSWDDIKKEWLGEAPFISHPLSSDWPDYHTHWTPLPTRPAAPTTEAV